MWQTQLLILGVNRTSIIFLEGCCIKCTLNHPPNHHFYVCCIKHPQMMVGLLLGYDIR